MILLADEALFEAQKVLSLFLSHASGKACPYSLPPFLADASGWSHTPCTEYQLTLGGGGRELKTARSGFPLRFSGPSAGGPARVASSASAPGRRRSCSYIVVSDLSRLLDLSYHCLSSAVTTSSEANLCVCL